MLYLEGGTINVDPGTMYHVVTDSETVEPAGILDQGPSELALRGLYFGKKGHRVIIDPGPGNWIQGFFPGYGFSSLSDAGETLRKNGLDPYSVTDVVLTHLHFDHCAGVFIQQDDLLLPAFPRATIHISRQQIELIDHPQDNEKDSFLPGFSRLIRKYYDISLYEGTDIPPFFDEVFFSDGHTRGMMSPVFSVEGKSYIYVSDLVPTYKNLNLKIVSGYDTDPFKLYTEKAEFFRRFENSDYRLIFFHEPDSEKSVVEISSVKTGR